MDLLVTSAPHYLPSRLYSVYPHPAQDPSEKRKYIIMLTSRHGVTVSCVVPTSNTIPRNADVPRALVRDMYTKSWSAFDRLISVVPPGGSIGFVSAISSVSSFIYTIFFSLDDKLFSFWLLQGDSHPLSHVKGIFRF